MVAVEGGELSVEHDEHLALDDAVAGHVHAGGHVEEHGAGHEARERPGERSARNGDVPRRAASRMGLPLRQV